MPVTTVSCFSGRGPAGAFLIASSVWVVSLIAAPYIAAHYSSDRVSYTAAAGVYVLGSVVCHQLPARSFSQWGVQLPVCARCAGLYAAAPFGAALALVLGTGRSRRVRMRVADLQWLRAVLITAAAPTLITVLGESAGLLEPSGWIRAALAVPLSVPVSGIVGLTLHGDLR